MPFHLDPRAVQRERAGQTPDAAAQGARQLTHRAVDAHAGLPAGTTSNHFRTRHALLSGVLTHVAAHEHDRGELLAASRPDDLAGALVGFVRYQLGEGRVETLACYALHLEAAWDDHLRHQLAASGAHAFAPLLAWLTAAGSPDPPADLRLLLDHLDGLVFHQLTMPVPDFDPEPSLRRVVAMVSRVTEPG
ncbi:TetR/AcrR family transcriptional regulator [Amycolatopsis sp. NBC_00345]|uniref:TetR/AcrR family transcriptional regulator n=1 Tax=Amycolatopsis sp. NBC_00345 TaxID=2975955 RepID=UPI002E26F210